MHIRRMLASKENDHLNYSVSSCISNDWTQGEVAANVTRKNRLYLKAKLSRLSDQAVLAALNNRGRRGCCWDE